MGDKINSIVTSRRFWAALASIIVVALKDKLPFDEEQITQIVLAIGAWIVGESLRSSQDIGRIVRSVALLAVLSCCLGSVAQAQIDLSYKKAQSLVGATAPRVIGDRIIIGEDSKPQVSVVAVIKVSSKDRYRIKARKSLFETAELVALTEHEYMLAGEGEYLIEVASVDHDASVKIQIGKDPPKPDPKPEPKPDPIPDPKPVPDIGNEYNVGAVALQNAPKDVSNARTLAASYRRNAARLYGQGGLADIQAVIKLVDVDFNAKTCTTREVCEAWAKWKTVVSNALTAEQTKRKTFTRQDWWASLNEIATALEGVK